MAKECKTAVEILKLQKAKKPWRGRVRCEWWDRGFHCIACMPPSWWVALGDKEKL